MAHIVRRGLRVARGRLLLAGGTQPVSRTFGYERGVPIHRYYVDRFFEAHAHRIHGRCLEFQNSGYVHRGRPTRIDVLDLSADNPNATIVADLTQPNDIPSDTFDCIVCDLMMPDLSGMDLHAELTRAGRGLERRMIFMTGGAFTSRAREFVNEVPNEVIEKPFSATRLETAIATVVKREGRR